MAKGIIFDMDNTLLQSRINFKQMRADLIQFLVQEQVGRSEDYFSESTPAQVLEKGKRLLNEMGEPIADIERQLLEIVLHHESVGMQGVQLEEGVLDGLAELHKKGLLLTIVTNNAEGPARLALERTGILSYFDTVVGREQMEALKPSPSGIQVVLKLYPQVSRWVMLGDSWIDGRAAQLAGVPFVSYRAELGVFKEKGVIPLKAVHHFSEFVNWIDSFFK